MDWITRNLTVLIRVGLAMVCLGMVVVWPGWRPSVAAQGGYIKIVDVKPIQVVEQPDFNNDGNDDLVLGKPTVVRVKTEIPNPPKLLPSERVCDKFVSR
jgi:hypothetical protein